MNRVRVKICGVTSVADARAAVAAGADAVGLVFYGASKRSLSVEHARAIARALPPFVTCVALFLDPAPEWVSEVVAAVAPDALQFHGRESAAFCRGFERPYLKSVPMGEDDIDPVDWTAAYHDAQGLLLDANRAGEAGGAGARFDWSAYRGGLSRPIVLAGGLDPDNVCEAVRRLAPYAVDVSSGVESEPGVKDAARMRAFVNAVSKAG